MDDKQKIILANIVLDYLNNSSDQSDVRAPKHVGQLNKTLGINGFKKAEPGTPVFDFDDRYFYMLESLDGKVCVKMTYYKSDLFNAIDFIDK